MTLNKLILHNYMIHRDFAADFDGNLIALTGEMGHGKSTFVGAIQFCLTGEHPPWNRADLLSWGASEGAAKLYFTQDGVECSILRKLHCSDVALKIGESREVITGARNVEKTLAEHMGVDKDILKQIGFVQQYEIQSILFDEPAKRERSFQKLLGIGDANKIWTSIGTVIQRYAKSENFDASIETLKQMIKRLETELGAVEGMLGASSKALSLLPTREELQAKIEKLAKIQSRLSAIDHSRTRIKSMNEQIAELTARLVALEADKSDNMKMLGCSIEEMDATVKQLMLDHGTALASLNNMKKLAGASDSDGKCPLCGAQVSVGQIASHTEIELKRLETSESMSRKLFEDTNSEFTKIKSRIKVIDGAISSINNSIMSYTATIDEEKAREKWAIDGFAELGISPDDIASENLKSSIDAELATCKETSAKLADLSSEVSALRGEKNAKTQQLQQAKEALDAKVKEKELDAPLAERLKILSETRDWFHSSNGPRTMSLEAIGKMTKYINEYLRDLNSEVEVTPDNQGLSFAYRYLDGRPVSDPPPSTAKLSGGQKIELALAFRLAIYRYFGQKMGIMVLDEPTAHLSPSGIEHFGKLLQTVSTLARNMNLQIIMPTHEKEILPFMDSEIHFD